MAERRGGGPGSLGLRRRSQGQTGRSLTGTATGLAFLLFYHRERRLHRSPPHQNLQETKTNQFKATGRKKYISGTLKKKKQPTQSS